MTTFGDFVALPLTLPPPSKVKFVGEAGSIPTAVHYMYIAPHTPKITTIDTSRSLLAANIPINADESNLRSLFANQLGGARIERVDLEPEDIIGGAPSSRRRGPVTQVDGQQGKKRKRADFEAALEDEVAQLPALPRNLQLVKSGSNATLVFVDEASQQLAMRAVRKAATAAGSRGKRITWDAGDKLTGMERYRAIHRAKYPPEEELMTRVTNYLTAYQNMEAQRAKAQARAGAVPDADGFITVTKGSRSGPAKAEAATQALEKQKTKAEGRIGDNFYRFQVREKAKERERELRMQFQDDVRKVEKLRERRKARGSG